MICGPPSERGVVPSRAAFAPLPTAGWPVARSGGQDVAQAPVQVLIVPVSFANRYRVRPCELTRIWPRPVVLATPTVAGCPDGVVGGTGEALAPPQAAAARAISGAVAALASSVRGQLRFMILLLSLGKPFGHDWGWRPPVCRDG